MNVDLPAGRYVVAVSGGVDSVVLLKLLASYNLEPKTYNVVVAHFDHGIRADSASDRKFVEELSRKYGLKFFYADGKLGANASEEGARVARYEFLEKIRLATKSKAIVTAHHQDDLLETAIINLLRGTNRRGLSSLKSTDKIVRPLLEFSKVKIKNYATEKKLDWREDPTNSDTKYLRNYVRHEILPKLDRGKLLEIINNASAQNRVIDDALSALLAARESSTQKLDRMWFVSLPDEVAREVLATWFRQNGIVSYDRKGLERLVCAARSARNGSRHNIKKADFLLVGRNELALVSSDC